MAIQRTGNIAPNRSRIPKKWSDYMLANYYADNVVPNISNTDYEGEINGLGDTVIIQKRFAIEAFDYVVGQGLQKQKTLADDSLSLTIDYSHYFNVPINDIDKFQAMGDWAAEVFDEGSRTLGTKIEKQVLQSIYAGITTVTATGANYTSGTELIKYLMQGMLKLNLLNVPDDGQRWVVIDPVASYMLGLGDLKAAYLTGDGVSALRSGSAVDKPVAGCKVFVSNNLLVTGAGANGTAKILMGHTDALTFAAQINKTETLRDQDDFGDLLRGQVVYGYKVVKPEAIVCIDTTYGASL